MNGYPLPIDLPVFQPALEYRLLQLLDDIDEPATSDYTFNVTPEDGYLSGSIDEHIFYCGHMHGELTFFLKKLSGGILISRFDCA